MSLNKSKALRTAEKYVLQGKIPAAIDEYRKVVDADPTDLTTINTLGDLYVRAGKIQDAISNFSRIAESYRESGFTLKAIAMLKKISKLDPTNIDTSMKLANLYSQQGLLVEARQQYLQVADAFARAGQARKALEAYQKIADLDPSNTSVRMKLGDIYSREGMAEQAHEAFIMAGTEFLRKGDMEQALNANLKAITVNPESRQGLTAIATIYTQQGQAARAINILCDAFEKNPGDVELLTILGRTYLSAGLMDDAERTFLSLVELDRNRYHYLLEVGRRFLQVGDFDRAAEQIDGCLEVLIAKREEDKAIDFLRRILDRDMNHVGSLKRLAQIFLRIREDHNLIATLNSLAEAAMRKGDDEEAIATLKELARLEPDEPMHRQRLYTLGVRDIVEPDSPDVVRATGPLDYQSAAFDDAFVIRQISEAEILAGHGQVEHAVTILTEILNHTPDNVQVHVKLKDIYLRAGMTDKAARECLELTRIYDARGESARASDYIAEAQQIDPSIETVTATAASRANAEWPGGEQAFGFQQDFGVSHENILQEAHAGFEVREDTDGLDLSKYQTGPLTDRTGFVMLPEGEARPVGSARKEQTPNNGPGAPGTQVFRYSDTLVGDLNGSPENNSPVAEMVFNAAGNMPSDTMSRILRDELEGIDFYIAQGYVEIARDTLDRLREDHGEHAEILSRYKRLGINDNDLTPARRDEPKEQDEGGAQAAQPGSQNSFITRTFEGASAYPSQDSSPDAMVLDFSNERPDDAVGDAAAEAGELTVTVSRSPLEGERKNVTPFLVQKESGPLQADLIVQLNTSELLNNTAFDPARPLTGPLSVSINKPVGTGDLIDSIVANFDSSFEGALGSVDGSPFSSRLPGIEDDLGTSNFAGGASANERAADLSQPSLVDDTDELKQMLEELKGNTGDLEPMLDFETHYSLGLAYKDMDLLDEAIEQFQLAFKVATLQDLESNCVHCYHMLGVCFKRKQMPKAAVMWFERGLKIPNRTEDEYQALRYEIGLCYEEMNQIDKAIDTFVEVYGIDVNYREVGDKIKQLQELKSA